MLPPQLAPSIRALIGGLKRDWNHKGATVTSGGSANAQTLTYSVCPAALVQGQVHAFIAGFTNTGATTLQVKDGSTSLTAKNVKIGSSALVSGQIVLGRPYVVHYDGASYQLLNPSIATGWTTETPTVTSGTGSFTSVSCSQKYLRANDIVYVIGSVTFTTVGTAAGTVLVPIPAGASAGTAAGSIVGSGVMSNGDGCQGSVSGGNAVFTKYDGTTVINGNGSTIVYSYFYQTS
jgi:hypothetical protein